MRKLGLLAAATIAVGSLSIVAPASAATIAEFEVNNSASIVTFTNNGAGGGTLAGSGLVNFDWLAIGMESLPNYAVNFSFNGTTFGSAQTFMGHLAQSLSGDFSFTLADAQVINGVNFAAGTNLLSGTFNGANLIARIGSSTGAVLSGTGTSLSSGVINIGAGATNDFSFNLAGISPSVGAASTGGFNNFTATIDGKFDSDGVISAPAIPEPATWAMMIGGFALLGASLRRRRALVEA